MIFQMTDRLNDRRFPGTTRWAVTCFAAMAIALSSTASTARAASDDEEELPDARLTGYAPDKVDIGGGVALSYALSALLGAIALGVTFKNARRTHLD